MTDTIESLIAEVAALRANRDELKSTIQSMGRDYLCYSDQCRERERELRARVAELEAKALPEGWVAVPKEPTGEMWSAGIDALRKTTARIQGTHKLSQAIAIADTEPDEVWKAMLAAAPSATQGEKE